MSNYSIFNFDNYKSIIPSFTSPYNPDYRMVPLYTVNGIPILTFLLVGVTAITLGYVTITENQDEKDKVNNEQKEIQERKEMEERKELEERKRMEQDLGAQNKGGKQPKNKSRKKSTKK